MVNDRLLRKTLLRAGEAAELDENQQKGREEASSTCADKFKNLF